MKVNDLMKSQKNSLHFPYKSDRMSVRNTKEFFSMSKLDRIRHFLNENKAGLAIVSDPVTVNYLTGFDCDPHERQMFLFVYENREPALFVPALEVARASAVLDFPVFGYVDSENPWQKIKAGLTSTDSPIIYAEFDNFNAVSSWNTMRVCGIVTCKNHCFKGHLIDTDFLHAKFDLSNDVCFSNVKRDIVETDIDSFISIITGNNHFLNFIS